MINYEAAELLPKAFPQLTTLHMDGCDFMYEAASALFWTLRKCAHLKDLKLKDPCHRDGRQELLWAAAESEADSFEHTDLLYAAAASQGWNAGSARAAAATGYLLSPLPLTTLTLDTPRAAAALGPLMLRGMGSRLQSLSIRQECRIQANKAGGSKYRSSEFEAPENLTPALQACSSLISLELSAWVRGGLHKVLPACPNLATLRSLHLPKQGVGQRLLDVILQGLPGERGDCY